MPKTPTPFTLDAELVLERETKNTVVYSTDDETAAVDTLYVKKAKLPTPFPVKFMLTLTQRT